MKALLVAAFAACIAVPAFGCDFTYDDVKAQFAKEHSPVFEIPADKLSTILLDLHGVNGKKYKGVTRALIANSAGQLLLGLEINGCLLDPIHIGADPKKGQIGI